MPLCSADQLPIRIGRKTKSSKSYSLINLNVIADVTRFPNYDTRSVVDKELFTDRSTGMNINSRLLVGPLCHHPWDKRDSKVH